MRNNKMQFTEKEINLAKQLKEAGLEWKPRMGDYFYWKGESKFVVGIQKGDGIIVLKGSYGISLKMDFDTYKDFIWLPLWHQCREILAKKGWFLEEHYDIRDEQLVGLWLGKERKKPVISGDEFDIIHVEGGTDVEAMYKALLEVITDVKTNNQI